jgi:hypothetical protein
MTKYVRKPIVVEAILWNGYEGVYEIVEEMVAPNPVDRLGNDQLGIHTQLGTRNAYLGDYVAKGDEGQIFVMDPGTFTRLYVEIEEDDDEIRVD